jgi:hypothetical protein
MAVNYSTAVKTARMQAVADAIDAGAAAGYMEIGTAGMALVLATITLDDPCGTVTGDTLTLSGLPSIDTSADATGTAAAARIRDSDDNDVVTGLTVGTSGTNIIIDNTSITAGQAVSLNSGTIQHAA